MKRLLFLLPLLLFITACGTKDIISEEFKVDIEQILPIVKEAHEKQEDYSEYDSDLIDAFHNKYKYGQYYISEEDDYYEMNDLEKALFARINTMRLFAVESELEKERPVLASQQKDEIDFYNEAKEDFEDLIKIKKIENLPDDLVNEYPTYEIVNGIYPEQFEEDAKRLIRLYDPIVNGEETVVEDEEWSALLTFLHQYKGDQDISLTDYEQDEKYYLVNSFMRKAIDAFDELKININKSAIEETTMDDFNAVAEDLKELGSK